MTRYLAILTALFLLPLTLRAVDATTVFNEVMYHPPRAGDSEWIELHNQMAVNMDLSGWRVIGGVNYTFPEGTTILAGGYLMVASDPTALQMATGFTGVLGPWTGALNNSGEMIKLVNRIGREMDVLEYSDSEAFSAAADGGGVSLAKKKSGLASEDPEHWMASPQVGGSPGAANFVEGKALGPPTTLTAYGAEWIYNQAGADLGSAWAANTYTTGTGGWESGQGVFAFEDDPVALPVGTALNNPGTAVTTHYFQRTFNFQGDPANTVLQLATLLDDGAVIFLNGNEVARINMPGGPVNHTTGAIAAVENATVSGTLTLAGEELVQGTNTLSVEVHQYRTPGSGVLQLVQQGGTAEIATNLARAAGATPFAKDVLIGYAQHAIPHLNDGVYGNNKSWIGNSQDSFCGVSFGATTKTVRGIAWGRDNTGTYTDRTLGTYTVQYTTTPNPTAGTPSNAWITIGSLNYTGPNGDLFSQPSRRHRYDFAPVEATGVRVITPGNGIGSGTCIDELELYSNTFNGGAADVVFGAQLVAREIILPAGAAGLTINEIGSANDAVWQIELRNQTGAPINVAGVVLAGSDFPAGYTLPAQTVEPGGLLVLNETQVGFRPQAGDRVFLYNAERTILLDAVLVGAAVRARSGPDFLVPAAATFGAENTFHLETGVVINEIMYHPPPNSSSGSTPVMPNPEEWIELHNRSTGAVDVSGWRMDGGTRYSIPEGTIIGPGEYLVLASDAAALRAIWPEVTDRIIGNLDGGLSNSGERLILRDQNGNPVDELRYHDGGTWPDLPDGNGASLELRDPRADNANGAAWGASDESSKTAWQTVSYRMNAAQRFGQDQIWREFRIGMLGSGECLIDDVSVVRDPDGSRQQLMQGGNFETLNTKWRFLGNHGTSEVVPEPGNSANHVLHVRATGQFGFNHNHIETTFLNNTALVESQTYEVSFRARYLSGSNQLNTRGYYARLARTTELTLPARIGTPGGENSQRVANIGPTMAALSHTPALPQPGQPVTVSVTSNDPDNVAGVTLRYALNGSASFTPAEMNAQGGGRFTASIPGYPAGTIVQFYVEGTDGAGAQARIPAGGGSSRALYIVDDSRGSSLPAHELRLIMLPADHTKLLTPTNRLSDGVIPGTVIYRRGEVFYNVGVRLQGTAAGRIRDGDSYVGYDISFPADQLFRGVHDNCNIDRSGRTPTTGGQDEIYVKHMFHHAGLPSTYDDLCYFVAPSATHTGTAILQMAGYGGAFLDAQFGGDGTIFNLDGTYEPSTTIDGNPESLKNPVPLAVQVQTDFTDLGADKEQYRGALEPRAGRRRDDFAGLMAFCQTIALPSSQLSQQIANRMNVDEWMRAAALYSLCGIGDTYMTGGFAHNLRVHVPSDGRNVSALPWDMDFTFNHPANASAILAGYNLRRVIELPENKRLYYGHLQDLCQRTFTSSYMSPWMTHYGSVVGQNMAAQATYINARRSSVLGQLPAQVSFNITTNGGAPFTIDSATATIEGTGWINIREFRRADTGAVVAATWPTASTWRVQVALQHGENPITLQAYDFGGQLLGARSITITSTLEAPKPLDYLRITEIHYNPADPSEDERKVASDNEDFEFVELRSLAPGILDISGCQFTEGIGFTFPQGTTLAPGESILVVRHSAAFRARYGESLRIAGIYGPGSALSNSGDRITLTDASGTVIQSFSYGDQWPWPKNADGMGQSLVVAAPHLTHDLSLASAWRSSAAVGGNPGGSDSTLFVGVPGNDDDGDGLSNFLEHALGTDAGSADGDEPVWQIEMSGDDLLFTFWRSLTADDVTYAIEGSTDLITWAPSNTELVGTAQQESLLRETYRITKPVPDSRLMLRLRVLNR